MNHTSVRAARNPRARRAHAARTFALRGTVREKHTAGMNSLSRRSFLATSSLALLAVPFMHAAEPEWVSLFDGKTLGKWKATDFAGRADVSIKDGEILLPQGGDMTGIHLEAAPAKMGYEVALEAKRIEGDDFFCGFTFPVGEKCVTLVVGGWGGSVVGISNVNGDNASENETTTYRNFKKGQWYHIRVRVTKAKVEAWIDKEQVVDLESEGKNLEMRIGEIESSMPFGIATWRTSAALKELRWRKL